MLPSSHRGSIYCFVDAIIKTSISLSPHTAAPTLKTVIAAVPNSVPNSEFGIAIFLDLHSTDFRFRKS